MDKNYQSGKPIFGEYTTFENAFPTIKNLKITVIETGRNVSSMQPAILEKDNFREEIKCSNLACISGGLPIGSLVRTMLIDKQTELEVKDCKCEGVEKQVNKICWNFFTYKIEIEYSQKI
jgi:hypothetical protein